MDNTQTTAASNGGGAPLPGTQRRVLVVEDDPTIADAIAARLRAEGFQVHTAGDGPAAVDTAHAWQPDLLVLDVMLPGFDGLEVCRRVQALRPVPVLMLTARDDETDMLVGLGRRRGRLHDQAVLHARAGGPGARAAAAGRAGHRGGPQPARRHPRSSATWRSTTRSAGCGSRGDDVHLTPTEFDLLACLAQTPRAVLSREQLLAEVWDWADASGTRTVDSHIKALRRKIGAERIRTVHGVGYALETPAP